MEDREDKASSQELINFMSYHPFSWDKWNVVVYVYQTMSFFSSSSFFINSGYSCSSIPLLDIFVTSGSHHCLEITSHTMVDDFLCR
jgi:hypothetical protein